MRYSTTQYATALMDALSVSKDIHATTLRFISVLRRHTALKRLNEILEKTKTIERISQGGRKIVITGADETALTAAAKTFLEKDEVTTILAKQNIGGISITVDGIRFDNTLRRRFDDLQKIVTNQ